VYLARVADDARTVLPGEEPPAPARGGAETLAPGTLLFGEYEVLEAIGGGGMGFVYRARHRSLGGLRAIKVMRDELGANPAAFEMFLREARALLEVQHDAVVRCHDLLRDPQGRVYLVMELAQGRTLGERLAQGPLESGELLELARRLADGLGAAHERGVIHRDLSPDNVILPDDRPDRAKLIDFGIARLAAAGDRTVAEGFKGKLGYASPEQLGFHGGAIDARSDVYTLGLLLAEAASGRALAMGSTLVEAIDARRTVPVLPRVIPLRLRRALSRLLENDPADRPTTAAEALALLEDALAEREPVPAWRAPALAGLALVAVVALALVGWWIRREAQPAPAPPAVAEPTPRGPAPVEPAGAAAPEVPPAPIARDFAGVRQALERAQGPNAALRARVWTEPDPVRDGDSYALLASADCACEVLVFLLDGREERVDLLYPNVFEPPRPLARGAALRIPSSGEYKLTAVGGAGVDVIKVIVAEEPLGFWTGERGTWDATPAAPERVAELRALLQRLRDRDWASASTTLRIVPR
jgi:serine/threonine-protein kinase